MVYQLFSFFVSVLLRLVKTQKDALLHVKKYYEAIPGLRQE